MDGIFALGYMSIINWPLAGDPTTSQKALVKLPYALWLKWMCQSRFSRSLTRIFLPSQLLNIAHRSFASSVFRRIMCIVFFSNITPYLISVKLFFHVLQIVIQSISPFFPVVMRDGGVLIFLNFFPVPYKISMGGRDLTMRMVSRLTVMMLRRRLMMYLGSPCSSHQRLGSLTMPLALSVVIA